MKKNFVKAFIMILLFLLCMGVSGCGIGGAAESESAESNSTEMKQISAGSIEMDRKTSETPKELPKTPQQQQSELLKQIYRTDGKNRNAYVLPIEFADGEYINRMECFQDQLLIFSGGNGLNVRLFHLDTGKLLSSVSYDVGYEDLSEGGFLEDGTIWAFVPARQTVYYLDQELETVDSQDMNALYRSVWYCDYEEDILWTQDYENGMLYYYQIGTRKIGEYSMEKLLGRKPDAEGSWWSMDKAGAGYVYLTVTTEYHNLNRYRLSALTGRMEEDLLANASAMGSSESGSWYQLLNQYRIVDFSNPEEVITLEGISEKEQLISYRQQYLFSGMQNRLYIYDCSSGSCYMGYEVNFADQEDSLWNYISSVAVRSDTRQVLFSVTSSRGIKLILCDLEMSEDVRDTEISRLKPEDICSRIDAVYRNIEQKYGIRMISLDEAKKRDDMSGYCLWDSIGILDELDAAEILERYLDDLPSHMVAEMLSGREGTVEICFSGTISGDESSGNLSYAGAYVTSWFDEEKDVLFTRMTADISLKDVLQTNFAHEWFHMMEDHIWDCEYDMFWGEDGLEEQESGSDVEARKELLENWESRWTAISPEDGYFYEYNEWLGYDEERGINVYVDDEDKENVYFIDSYSRTFPKEDRARIFENLYISGLEGKELPPCFESEHLRRKAVYLCRLIRCCYPSADTDGRNTWEQGLCQEDWEQIVENRDCRQEQF